jgi:hypothetical protein
VFGLTMETLFMLLAGRKWAVSAQATIVNIAAPSPTAFSQDEG